MVDELIQVGEYQVALENLCTQTYEHELQVGDPSLTAVRRLAADLGVDDRYWKLLDRS